VYWAKTLVRSACGHGSRRRVFATESHERTRTLSSLSSFRVVPCVSVAKSSCHGRTRKDTDILFSFFLPCCSVCFRGEEFLPRNHTEGHGRTRTFSSLSSFRVVPCVSVAKSSCHGITRKDTDTFFSFFLPCCSVCFRGEEFLPRHHTEGHGHFLLFLLSVLFRVFPWPLTHGSGERLAGAERPLGQSRHTWPGPSAERLTQA